MYDTLKANIPLGKGVIILKKDNLGLIALEKPISIKSHPNSNKIEKNCLIEAQYNFEKEYYYWNENQSQINEIEKKLYLINRLDSPTSGIVLVTFIFLIAENIKELYRKRKVTKIYYAIVKNEITINFNTIIWKDKLKKINNKNLRVYKGGKNTAITKIVFNKTNNFKEKKISLLEMHTKTGRTHQLRVQSSIRNYPIIGDKTYGNFKFNNFIEKIIKYKRLYLHSSYLSLNYSFLLNKNCFFEVQSNLPESFHKLINLKI